MKQHTKQELTEKILELEELLAQSKVSLQKNIDYFVELTSSIRGKMVTASENNRLCAKRCKALELTIKELESKLNKPKINFIKNIWNRYVRPNK
jgi:hypothetical protein